MAVRRDVDLPRLRDHRAVGHRRRDRDQPRGPPRDPVRAVRSGAHRWRGSLEAAPPRDRPDDVAGPVLLAGPGHRLRVAVLPRPARPQERHRRARRLDDVLQPEHLPDVLHLPADVLRRDPGLAPVRDHAGDHGRALQDLAALRLLRGRAMTNAARPRRRPAGRSAAELTRTAVLTTLYVAILLVFLAPLGYAFV